MRNINLILITFSILLLSCNTPRQKTIVINNLTGENVDSIFICLFDQELTFAEMHPRSRQEKSFQVINHDEKDQSAFLIRIYAQGKIQKAGTFGYYSNSFDMKNHYELNILPGFRYAEIEK